MISHGIYGLLVIPQKIIFLMVCSTKNHHYINQLALTGSAFSASFAGSATLDFLAGLSSAAASAVSSTFLFPLAAGASVISASALGVSFSAAGLASAFSSFSSFF